MSLARPFLAVNEWVIWWLFVHFCGFCNCNIEHPLPAIITALIIYLYLFLCFMHCLLYFSVHLATTVERWASPSWDNHCTIKRSSTVLHSFTLLCTFARLNVEHPLPEIITAIANLFPLFCTGSCFSVHFAKHPLPEIITSGGSWTRKQGAAHHPQLSNPKRRLSNSKRWFKITDCRQICHQIDSRANIRLTWPDLGGPILT